jgi:DNA-binding IscR family transcriptional regulator
MTVEEAAVVDVLRRKRVASVFDVAVVAKLSPNVVRQVVTRLHEDGLVDESGNEILKLTKRGAAISGEAIGILEGNAASSSDAEDALARAESALEEVISRL